MSEIKVEDIETAVREEYYSHSATAPQSAGAMCEPRRVASEIQPPGIATILTVFALLGGFGGMLMIAYGVAAGSGSHVVSGLTSLFSASVIGGFAKVIEYLAKIEHHLRPEKRG